MDRLCPEDLERLAKLESPTRNRYFYGKLLTERHFDLEQRYFNRKRWLLNRLTLGSGVICGLNVVRAAGGKLQVTAGVAIDGFGREIVVPEMSRPFDPTVLTDECGQPTGEPAKGPVTICLAYHECDIEPVPVRVTECETEQRCAPSLALERYMVLVLEAGDRPPPIDAPRPPVTSVRPPLDMQPIGPGLRFRPLRPPIICRHPGLFEHSPAEIHHELVGRELEGCPDPGRACVALARVEGDSIIRDVRSLVYPAPLLYELILCLSQRVEKCCHALTLHYVSGDVQHGAVERPLPEDLVVQVLDGEGQPVADETVTFRVQGGGGSMLASNAAEHKVQSGPDGKAAARWVLGTVVPLQTATARLENGASVGFHATVAGRSVAVPPKVAAVWPTHGMVIKGSSGDLDYQRWMNLGPYIELSFDQVMNASHLDNPDTWLGVYWFRPEGNAGTIRRLMTALAVPAASTANVPLRFQLKDLEIRAASARYLILIRAENGNITAASPSGVLLDADFAGTLLSHQRLAQLWAMKPGDQVAAIANVDKANFAPVSATLPSGDGAAGGVFHSFFTVS
jgi:hypothetical protein